VDPVCVLPELGLSLLLVAQAAVSACVRHCSGLGICGGSAVQHGCELRQVDRLPRARSADWSDIHSLTSIED
jgi:hypothetical protein